MRTIHQTDMIDVRRELLFLHKVFADTFSLQDSGRHHIAYFKTEQEARNWCAENNYRIRII